MVRPARTGNAAHLEVQSRSRRTLWHLVDLTAYRGSGSCECEDFVCRHEPELQRGHPPGADVRCKHIEEAREHLLDAVIRQLSKPGPNQPHKLIARA